MGLKVHRKNSGPYRVTKVGRNDRYRVSKIEGEGPNETWADYMSPWEGFSRDHVDDDEFVGSDDEEEDDEPQDNT